MMADGTPTRGSAVERRVGVAILVGLAVAATWLAMSLIVRRPPDPLELSGRDFEDVGLSVSGWQSTRLNVSPDSIEPNILCFLLTRASAGAPPASRQSVTARLVHGYNMVDCMRIKGWMVEEKRYGSVGVSGYGGVGVSEAGGQESGVPGPASPCLLPPASCPLPPDSRPPASCPQLWQLVSRSGETSLWTTVMLRADTLRPGKMDVRAMRFPRVGVPDDPDWVQAGFTKESLRHPIASLRRVVRAKWNASRCDWLTFLGLRKPVWVETEWLTLVVAWESGMPADRAEAERELLAIQSAFGAMLADWRRVHPVAGK